VTSATVRPVLDGTRKVVRFNWPKYVAAVAVVAASVRWAVWRPPFPGSVLLWLVATAATIWTCSSLVATWWVYDHKRIYDLVGAELGPVGRYAAVHAGFDDATPHLERSIGYGPVAVADLQVRPRGSLRRARDLPMAHDRAPGPLPIRTAALDSVFLTFAIHEVRPREDQLALFAELHRVLVPGGRLVVTEHMLDPANLGVFGPGALHFQRAENWRRRARETRFDLVTDDRLTPFVRRLVWQR
jgi:SAM-dependent methyltransferase